ncbi:hypothetical protein V2J09_016987 [Rumex salicifolius]
MSESKVQIRVTETVAVRPSKPPFDADHLLPLSHLDNDLNLRTTVRYLRSYSPSSSIAAADPFHVITDSLSKALVAFYPLAGTLRRLPNGRLELFCSADGGVPVVRAVADCSLDSVSYLDDPGGDYADDLVPDPGPEEALVSPFVLQVTVFTCGGFCLGVAAYNALCDGQGAGLVFGAMVGFAHGSDRIPVEPVWDRMKLLGPRDVPRVSVPLEDVLVLDKEFLPYGSGSDPVRKVCFHVKNEWVERFKKLLLDRSGCSFTTFEALGAFIWRANVKSSSVAATETVKFAYLINIRKALTPPLPKGYWGNGCVTIYVPLAAGDLVGQPIWETAGSIKASKANATDEYVRSLIDFHQLNYEKGITGGKGVSGFTDWRHLGHSDVDFGWGGPVNVVPLSRHLMGSSRPCFLLPLSGSNGAREDGFRVVVTVEETAVDGFLEEMAELGTVDFGSSSL